MRWSREAADCLEGIRRYLDERSPAAASATVAGIYRLASSLDRFPLRGFGYQTRSGREVRIVLYGHYRVVYRVDEGDVAVVLGIFHGAMDLSRLLH